MSQVRKRQILPRLNARLYFTLSIFLTCLIVGFWLSHKLNQSKFFPIKKVEIIGVHKADHDEIQNILKSLVDNGFFSVDVEYIKDQLLHSPWIGRVAVQRLWPDRVVITVEEKNPVARWNNNSLLGMSGDLFTPPKESYPNQLPDFIGPEGEQITMLQYYNQINNLISPLHFKISRLELSPTNAWNLSFENGINVNLGTQEILPRIKHFVKVYTKIIGDRFSEVKSIDLRYPNGIAVKWKTVEQSYGKEAK